LLSVRSPETIANFVNIRTNFTATVGQLSNQFWYRRIRCECYRVHNNYNSGHRTFSFDKFARAIFVSAVNEVLSADVKCARHVIQSSLAPADEIAMHGHLRRMQMLSILDQNTHILLRTTN